MGWVINATLRPLYPEERDRVPILREAGSVPGSVWTGAGNLTPPGFDPQTVQAVASRCTDRAIPPHNVLNLKIKTKLVVTLHFEFLESEIKIDNAVLNNTVYINSY
jgi:hypothetical protein